MSRHGHHGCHHDHGNHSHHYHGHHGRRGLFGRFADRLGISRKWIILGFVFLVIVNLPLALLVLGLAWLWMDKPQVIDKAGDTISSFGRKMKGDTARDASRQTGTPRDSDGPATFNPDADPWFQDLRRKFKDLEERTGDMEQFIVSKEYKLRRDFKQMGEA